MRGIREEGRKGNGGKFRCRIEVEIKEDVYFSKSDKTDGYKL